MAEKYTVEIISQEEKEQRMEAISKIELYEKRALVHGTCVKFFTDSPIFKEMWEDNFEPLPEWFRPHVRIFSISGPTLKVFYEPNSKTVIIEGCDYYGWVKSIALGLVADFMEDFTFDHRRYSVHGSFLDCNGRGLALIGPSGSGKTTLTYGLLLDKKNSFVTDDWFFVKFAAEDTLIFSSEKNSYIRNDLSTSLPMYAKKIEGIKLDSRDRAIVDVKRLFGSDRIRTQSNLIGSVLLTRNKSLPPFKKLTPDEAIKFLVEADFCNPHQLVRTPQKIEKRKKFFLELFKRSPVYLLNTIETPMESINRLKELTK